MNLFLEIPKLNRHFPFRCFTNQGDTLVYPHWHKEIEIIYVTKGTLQLGINDEPVQMRQGEIQFINGGDVHFFLASPDSERAVIQFDLQLFQEVLAWSGEDIGLRDVFTQMAHSSLEWPEETASRMRKLIEDIFRENAERGPAWGYRLKARVFDMFALIVREVPSDPHAADPRISEDALNRSRDTLGKLERIFNYVESHYREPISLGEVADYMGFSPYYFTKLFKRNTGMTFIEFLNEYRLNKAKWLLLNEETSMAEVAESAGFGSVKTFHHLFKESTGVSPLRYRRTIFGNNTTRM
ncbi:helix-turn-helix transcriptional regulator [Paenibacillus glufosinatiresistens]|uniref:helix-turn-helix transcriptional regulator n=1 Tax=Paenibacillus glufosinatiresistens TaxID=3070657 RepID=UPI00286DA6C8|nr:AraC family transcriptional regulator [Paenibacillus sp. YX.27]